MLQNKINITFAILSNKVFLLPIITLSQKYFLYDLITKVVLIIKFSDYPQKNRELCHLRHTPLLKKYYLNSKLAEQSAPRIFTVGFTVNPLLVNNIFNESKPAANIPDLSAISHVSPALTEESKPPVKYF